MVAKHCRSAANDRNKTYQSPNYDKIIVKQQNVIVK